MVTDYRFPTSAIDCRHRKQASDDFSIVGDNRGITSGNCTVQGFHYLVRQFLYGIFSRNNDRAGEDPALGRGSW
jgi:hypothetical protein